MFRPNRIGTPNLHTGLYDTSTADWAPSQAARTSLAAFGANVINAVPQADFGKNCLAWTGAASEVITANYKFSLVQQFTVTPPLAGDVVGIEIIAHLKILCPASATIRGTYGKTSAAAGAILAAVSFDDIPTQFDANDFPSYSDDTIVMRDAYYLTQVIQQYSTNSGTFLHGFEIIDNSGANFNLDHFTMNAAVRQLNDQQDIGYRDTLR